MSYSLEHRFAIDIANLCINFNNKLPSSYYIEKDYFPFIKKWQIDNEYEYCLSADHPPNTNALVGVKPFVFGMWKGFALKESLVFIRGTNSDNPHIQFTVRKDYKKGIVNFFYHNFTDEKVPIFSSGLSQLIYQNIMLANSIGLIVHASCLKLFKNNKSILFAGPPGSGKSTLARLAMSHEFKRFISVTADDRIILKNGPKLFCYGSPWPGEVGLVKNEESRVSKLYFISHGRRNEVKHLSLTDAMPRLIARTFPPLWNKEFIATTIDLCWKILQNISCYNFSFIPDNSAIEYILEHNNC